MNPSLNQLRAFVAVAEFGSFTQAARHLHLTQSAVSVLIKELEREVGIGLFDRTTRKISLTEAGNDFLPAIKRLMGDLETALHDLSQLRDVLRGVLRVAAPPLMAYVLLPQVLADFHTQHPNVEIQIIDTLPETLLDQLRYGRADIAVGPDGNEHLEEVTRHFLFRDRHWLVCTRGHRLAGRKRVVWKDLHSESFIAPTRDFLRRLRPNLDTDARQVLTQPVLEVSYITTAIGMVAAGFGVTACPTYAADWVKASGLHMTVIEDPIFYREVYLYSLAGKTLPPAAATFLTLLREHVHRLDVQF